jgi:predicted amino acid-binding ACT domain protein
MQQVTKLITCHIWVYWHILYQFCIKESLGLICFVAAVFYWDRVILLFLRHMSDILLEETFNVKLLVEIQKNDPDIHELRMELKTL